MALFAFLGEFQGGDGKTNFALPDLRGRSPSGAAVGEKDSSGGHDFYKPGERVPPVSEVDAVSPEQWDERSPPHLAVNFLVAMEGIYPQMR
jgi:microcystin-dependent protein